MDEDGFGIVYIIENAQQFWSELEDILHIPNDLTLEQLDATMRRFVSFCASYHEQYLQDPLQLEHSCDLLMSSELFVFHSERMSELLLDDSQNSTNPHTQLILYNILLSYGRRKEAFFRSHKRWQPLFPLLMDHIRLGFDEDVDDGYISGSNFTATPGSKAITVPIETKLRMLSVRLLYEACRVQKPSLADLRIFDDLFIEYLFDVVEWTRDSPDDTFNYTVIKLIVALNEQFMVASLEPRMSRIDGKSPRPQDHMTSRKPEEENRVFRILIARMHSSMTLGENLIFMLNRADRTQEDMVMQLLVLKLLYLIFTTRGTTDFFYTNDLCVLVDVFLREILDLDESNESLRHTYLRVLHPLLTKTQLRDRPYKRPQIVQCLESLIKHANIRDVDPTTKRLVERCLSGEWCVQLRSHNAQRVISLDTDYRADSPGIHSPSSQASTSFHASRSHTLLTPTTPVESSEKSKGLKGSRSHEHFPPDAVTPSHKDKGRTLGETLRRGSNDSSVSLPKVATASTNTGPPKRRARGGSVSAEMSSLSLKDRKAPPAMILDETTALVLEPPTISVTASSPFSPPAREAHSPLISASFPSSSSPHVSPLSESMSAPVSPTPGQRRPPPPPPKRRKPPAIPTSKSHGGTTITTIASSSTGSLVANTKFKR
ncbi:hypothetical protein BDY19DRAFT_893658 [Irpex rosettiformis]|uniref:Uncharacterized protein n=1 Tax=Irpex rosettiformis TaxID=378272 RepID=A0ACB8TZD1_9APHY|nr:hypothetical protein BDY19DRAFT_893658 [Irpex rosettiformis]